ncbi:MAG TPA: Fe-S cluster assembly protein SufD [Stellaceae bacterium]|nr:Fe-S cluster assembly protein SufD [Stellaceae bacterium]
MSTLLDFPAKPEARPYVEAFAAPDGEPPWLAEDRRRGLARFAEAGFPSRRSEAWRYLDLRALEQRPMPPRHRRRTEHLEQARAQAAELTIAQSAQRIVLVDGRFAAELSNLKPPPGVWFGAMSQAIRERSATVREALNGMQGSEQPFAALNTALFSDGVVLDIGPGVTLAEPIQILHLASGASEESFHTRSLIALGAGSCATVLETYRGDGAYWRNDVVDWVLDEEAALDHVALVEEAPEAVHLAAAAAELKKRARLSSLMLLLGGGTVRREASVRFDGPGARCALDGGFVVGRRDEANIVTTVDHAAPEGETRELFKGVAAGRGHGAFQGRIIVREGAQKVDARQSSRNLLLGRQAVIDTKPELEILADDVKCSHGATVGDLDEAALFYLRARGIAAEEARRMLIEAFVREAVEPVERTQIRDFLLQRLSRRLAALEP